MKFHRDIKYFRHQIQKCRLSVVQSILTNKSLIKKIQEVSDIWLNNDHDVIGKLFKELYQSDLYKTYILENSSNVDIDQRFFVSVLNNHVLNNQLVSL